MTLTERRPAKSARRGWLLPDPLLLTVLSFGTGFLDALTYLGLDRIFGANMTGNLILVGIGLSGDWAELIHPLVALLAFCVGCMVAGLCNRLLEATKRGSPAPRMLFLTTGVLLAVSTALAFMNGNGSLGLVITALIGVAMGCQSLAARLLAVPEINTVVVTSTLSQFFAEAGAGRTWRKRRVSARQLAAVGSMLGGAIVGAAVVPFAGLTALAVPTALVLLMALFCRRLEPQAS
jgi:uncharacterized membrane protein YoaK (UPF0700 family)